MHTPKLFCTFVATKREISILIPVYNGDCRQMVESLSRQAQQLADLEHYEIIVADDGSSNRACVTVNSSISTLPHCRFIDRQQNVGRAAIRNFLAQTAQYEWLLFIDGDMTITHDDYLATYLNTEDDQQVVYGGYHIGTGEDSNLRYLYEKASAHQHTAEERQKRPYQHFHTANFMVSREVMLAHPFDERFRTYGYEDVLFGKTMRQNHISISHIDNTVGFCKFESNEHFVSKTEEGLRTLHAFRNDLRGYSNLLTFVEGIHLKVVRGAIRLWHTLFGKLERRNLCGKHPRIRLLKIYKIGYYLKLRIMNYKLNKPL